MRRPGTGPPLVREGLLETSPNRLRLPVGRAHFLGRLVMPSRAYLDRVIGIRIGTRRQRRVGSRRSKPACAVTEEPGSISPRAASGG
jgi:hypothetical protein